MKRFLLSGLMLLALGCTQNASAQSNSSSYDDDIYYNSDQAKDDAARDAKRDAKRAEERRRQDEQSDATQYSSSGNDYDNAGGNYDYANGDDYIDYDDDYYYASHLARFNNPFYNRGYYSGYYNPYWYDRNWVDPTWGYNPWQPSFSISYGYGPYWTSGWGWSAWYGYTPFNSYYNYPYYGGGYGGYYGCGAPYYSGYWNGYYSGVYNNYGNGYGYRNTSYGPRYSLNGIHNTYIRNNTLGHRSALFTNGATTSVNQGTSMGPRQNGLRTTRNANTNANTGFIDGRNGAVRTYDNGTAPVRGNGSGRNEFGNPRDDRSTRTEVPVRNNDNGRNFSNTESATPRSERRGGFFSGSGRSNDAPTPRVQQQQTQRVETPRSEGRTFSQPRTENRTFSQPRSESPRSNGGNFGGGGSRSSGGNSGGGGGRSFGGRR